MVPALMIFDFISEVSVKDNLNLSEEEKHIIMVMSQINYFDETFFPLFVNSIRGDGNFFTVQDMDSISVLPEFKMSNDKWNNDAIPIIQKTIKEYQSFSHDDVIKFFNIEGDSFINNIVRDHGVLALSDVFAIVKSHKIV